MLQIILQTTSSTLIFKPTNINYKKGMLKETNNSLYRNKNIIFSGRNFLMTMIFKKRSKLTK